MNFIDEAGILLKLTCDASDEMIEEKWISGKLLPSLDNFVILSRLLHTSIEDILVIDGDIGCLWGVFFGLLM